MDEVVKGGHAWYDDETADWWKRPAQGKEHAGLNSVSGEDVREHSAKRQGEGNQERALQYQRAWHQWDKSIGATQEKAGKQCPRNVLAM